MHYLPSRYDTRTFSALIAASGVCILCALIIVPVSVVLCKSHGQSVKLGRKTNVSQPFTLASLTYVNWSQKYLPTMRYTSVVLDAFQFIVSLVVMICAHELFSRSNKSLKYYSRPQPEWFDPPLPAHGESDDVRRYYHDPRGWSPLEWNCGLQGWIRSPQQHRIFQLCQEGLAARALFAILFGFQVVVLASHTWIWWIEKKGRTPWMGQRLDSQEQLPDNVDRSE